MSCVIQTFSGKIVNPLDLRPEDICIEDIAHALACCNRFAGHVKRPISVAQHSIYVSRLCDDTGYELQGLLHDASEAYLGDITKWLKATPALQAFRQVEDHAQKIIYRKFNCTALVSDVVEMADRIMVRFEGGKGFRHFTIDHPNYPPLSATEIARVGAWGFWTWRAAEEAFLLRFREIFTERLQVERSPRGPRGNPPPEARRF